PKIRYSNWAVNRKLVPEEFKTEVAKKSYLDLALYAYAWNKYKLNTPSAPTGFLRSMYWKIRRRLM
ncbi:MAG: hypothetical protein MJA83_18030, partial [Gammaproteobacteria bacterium]|nr:hypothetical protein [Gammaproteobacteria bacterium]